MKGLHRRALKEHRVYYLRGPYLNRVLWQVVVGVEDPNPLVGGQGIKTLESAGITVELIGGNEERDCYAINEDFMARMKAGG